MQILKNYTLLIVEDEVEILSELSEYYEDSFKNIYTVKDGKEALELFKKYNPEVVLLDIYIPFIDGLEVAKIIRQNNEKTIIVMLSAHTETDILLKATELNLTKYFVKPLDRKKSKEFLSVVSKKLEELYPYTLYVSDDLYYCYDKKVFIFEDKEIMLSKKEILFIEYIIKNKNQVISIDRIVELLYRDDFTSSNFKSRVKTFISVLKKKIPKLPLKNSYGVGYKLDFES